MARLILVLLLLAAPLAGCGDTASTARQDTQPASTSPAPTTREPIVLWGGAIHGLRVGLEPAKRNFAQGEDLIFTLKAQNVLEKPFKVPGFADGAWCYKVTFQAGDDYRVRGPAIDKSPANDAVLQPGDVWTKQVNLSRGTQLTKAGGGSVDSLPPGLYEVMGGYYNMKGEGYWVGGQCWTNIVTIRIE